MILGSFVIRGLDWYAVSEEFKSIHIIYTLCALCIFICARVLLAYRWQVLFLEDRLSLWRLFLIQNAGVGLNNLVPIRVIGEASQFILLTLKYKVRFGVGISTLGMERVLDLLSSASILIAGLFLLPSKGVLLPYVGGAFVIAISSLVMVRIFIWLSTTTMFQFIPWLSALGTSFIELTKARKRLSYSLLLTIVYWLMIGFVAWVVALGMDMRTLNSEIISPIVATVTVILTLYIITVIPSLPAAAGTFEFSVVYILRLFGVESEIAISYALVIHVILFLPPVIIAIIVFSNAGTRSIGRNLILAGIRKKNQEASDSFLDVR